MILWALWRRGLLRRADREKIELFLGRAARSARCSPGAIRSGAVSGIARLVVSPSHAAGVARWLEYRMNLFDGVEG